MKHSKSRRPDKPNPLPDLICDRWRVVKVSWRQRTEQDGDRCHHTAAEGEGDATGCVGTVGRFDGDVEIEGVEDPGGKQKRSQDREESRNAARETALTPAAALSTLGGLLRSLAGLHPALRAPRRQLHALQGRANQRSALVHRAVNTGGLWAASCSLQAIGKVSLRGRGGAADAAFCGGGVRTLLCNDVRAADMLILLLLFGHICSGLLREVVCGPLLAESKACSNQIRGQHQAHPGQPVIPHSTQTTTDNLNNWAEIPLVEFLPQNGLNVSFLSNKHGCLSPFKHPVSGYVSLLQKKFNPQPPLLIPPKCF